MAEGEPQLLEQALRSGDESLLSFILHKTDAGDIEGLVSALSSALLFNLVQALKKHLDDRPENLGKVVEWMEVAIALRKADMAASAECQRSLSEFKYVLKERTQHIAILEKVGTMVDMIEAENEGPGVGLPVYEGDAQFLAAEE